MAKRVVTVVVETKKDAPPPSKKDLRLYFEHRLGVEDSPQSRGALARCEGVITKHRVRSVDID